MKIGCHISVSKGFLKASQRAKELGAEAFQVFTKNPRGLRPKNWTWRMRKKGPAIAAKTGWFWWPTHRTSPICPLPRKTCAR